MPTQKMEIPALNSPSVKAFMAKISTSLNTTFPVPSQVLSFGSILPELIPRMNSLVLSGVKRGMAGFPAPLNPISGDLIIAVDTAYQPAILVRVLSRTAVPFTEVTSKFVFEEGHPELTIEFWKEWHQKFWEKSIDHDGTEFGSGEGRKVLNMIFEVVWPVPKPLTVESDPVKALLELVERVKRLKVEVEHIKEVFEFGERSGEGNKRGNSLAVAGKKMARVIFPFTAEEQRKVGGYSVRTLFFSVL
jgi:uncharacterized protein YhfF